MVYIPNLILKTYKTMVFFKMKLTDFSASIMEVLAFVSSILASIPKLCTPSSSIACLPTILFLSTSVLKYIVLNVKENFVQEELLKTAFTNITQSFKKIITCDYALHEDVKEAWDSLLQR